MDANPASPSDKGSKQGNNGGNDKSSKNTPAKTKAKPGAKTPTKTSGKEPSATSNTGREREKVICDTVIQDFTSTIWPILQRIGFTYSASKGYFHPHIPTPFDHEAMMAVYLVKSGIPIVDYLTDQESVDLGNYVKFAHVPKADLNTARANTGSLDLSPEILPDDQIREVLKNLGFEFLVDDNKRPMIRAPGATLLKNRGMNLQRRVHYFRNLEEVRVYVRSTTILTVGDPRRANTRCRNDATLKDQRSQDRLSVRLWGATSKEPLPTFQAPAQSSSKAKKRQCQESSKRNGKQKRARLTPAPGERTKQSHVHAGGAKACQSGRDGDETTKSPASLDSVASSPVTPNPRCRKAQMPEGQLENASAPPIVGQEGQEQQDAPEQQWDSGRSQSDRSLKAQYQLLRMDIHMQREVRNANRWEVGLDSIHEDPIPETPPPDGELERAIEKLQRILANVRFEIVLLLDMSPVESD